MGPGCLEPLSTDLTGEAWVLLSTSLNSGQREWTRYHVEVCPSPKAERAGDKPQGTQLSRTGGTKVTKLASGPQVH